ncbi:MAG: tRNA pseudouridine(38-40) synthase TruA [Thermodesulfobacteriota bacterium]
MGKHPRRFRLTLEYDGSRYSGWQRQTDARTIQGSLLAATAQVLGRDDADIQGAGRTDGGVHALRYTAHLEAVTALPPDELCRRLNDVLPQDIAILEVAPCDPRFHARHHCVGRSYLYRIARRKTALARKYSWWVGEGLDTTAMAAAAARFVGMHDFASFAEKQELKKSTQVLVHLVEVEKAGEFIDIRVVGSHFLWRMVRRMVGVLVEVGRGGLTAAEVEKLLATRSEAPVRLTAPAMGLFFERAFYDETELTDFLGGARG